MRIDAIVTYLKSLKIGPSEPRYVRRIHTVADKGRGTIVSLEGSEKPGGPWKAFDNGELVPWDYQVEMNRLLFDKIDRQMLGLEKLDGYESKIGHVKGVGISARPTVTMQFGDDWDNLPDASPEEIRRWNLCRGP